MLLIFAFIKINENYFGIFGVICLIIIKYSVNLRYYYKNEKKKFAVFQKQRIFHKAFISYQKRKFQGKLQIYEIQNFKKFYKIFINT